MKSTVLLHTNTAVKPFAAFCVLVLFYLLNACAEDSGDLLVIDEKIEVTAVVAESEEYTADQLRFYLIHPLEGRQQIVLEKVDSGEYTFMVESDQLYTSLSEDPALRALSAGRGNEASAFKERGISENITAYLRFEIVAAFAEDAEEILYHQQVTPLSLGELLKARPTVNIGSAGPVTLQKVGRRKVDFVSNEPFYFASIPTYRADDFDFANFLGFLPVITRSEEAQVWVYPLPIQGENPEYQIVSWLDLPDSPLVSSEIQDFSLADRSLEINLIPTDAAVITTASETTIRYSTPVKSQIIDEGTDAERYQGYVNSERVLIDRYLKHDRLEIAGVILRVYAGDEARGTPFFEREYPYFSSRYEAFVPQTFADGSTENGSFTISLEDRLSGEEVLLYGAKSVGRPIFDPDSLVLQSVSGYEGILSGNANAVFSMSYTLCPVLGEIGILLPQTATQKAEIIYTSCEGEAQNIELPRSVLPGIGAGGEYNLSFYVRDRFGNQSSALLDGSLQNFPVYLDYGIADLANQTLTFGFHFGLAPLDATAGSDASPYVFAPGTIVTSGTVGDFALRFASTERCRHNAPSTADGSGLGHYLAGFRLAKSPQDHSQKWQDFTACANDLTLNAESIAFPDNPGDAATIYLQVMDRAGNASNVHAYALPHCDNRPGDFTGCWQ